MRIINLLYQGSNINYGVWISAISTAQILKDRFGVYSEIWYPKTSNPLENPSVKTVQLERTSTKEVKKMIEQYQLNPKDTIIQTHGSWRYTSRWGYIFKKLGYKWIYHPHGMLNQHGFEEKGLKKSIYWHLIEQFLMKHADVIRLVSSPEALDLKWKLKNSPPLCIIPNGVEATHFDSSAKDKVLRYVLFMSRLFHGKGVVPMVKGWLNSQLNNNSDYQLVIAGPDQGELEKINLLLKSNPTSNIRYIGPIYREEKEKWLNSSSFYILPSYSEAFSTSILEGMAHGLIPIITPNCNFPEVFNEGLGIKIETSPTSIARQLNNLPTLEDPDMYALQERCAHFIQNHYTLDQVAQKQYDLFLELIRGKLETKSGTYLWNPIQAVKGSIIGKLT